MTALDKRVEKLEEREPECDIVKRLIEGRRPDYPRTSMAELEELARRHGGLYRRILEGRRNAGIPK